MPKIFISYRRDDSEFQSHFICKELRKQFGADAVFIDVDTLLPGMDFRKHLSDAVNQCDVLLAIIGDRWLHAVSEDGQRRLASPRDFVRIEIEAALLRDIPVVPVLMGRVSMPNEKELPAALAQLAYRHAVAVRSGSDFDNDVDRMIRGIMRLLESRQKAASSSTGSAQDATFDKSRSQPQQSEERNLEVQCLCGAVLKVEKKHWGKTTECPKCTNVVSVPILNSIGMKLEPIQAGSFKMGSPNIVEKSRGVENPQHRVRISKPFFLGMSPVTQIEYEKVIGHNPSN